MLGKFTVGWQLMILGMGTVFVMLYLLSLILKTVGHYFGPKVEKNDNNSTPVQPVAATKEAEDKNAKVAAVMAAIQAVMGDSEYRVISIKPKSSSGWKSAINEGQEYNYGGKGN